MTSRRDKWSGVTKTLPEQETGGNRNNNKNDHNFTDSAVISARDSSLESSIRLFIEYDIEERQLVRGDQDFAQTRNGRELKQQQHSRRAAVSFALILAHDCSLESSDHLLTEYVMNKETAGERKRIFRALHNGGQRAKKMQGQNSSQLLSFYSVSRGVCST